MKDLFVYTERYRLPTR